MNRRPRQPINTELEELEQELAALTLRVAAIRTRIRVTSAQPSQTPVVGDRVRFTIAGSSAEGVIISVTAQRVRIQQDITHHIFLRAPHNVIII
jgi:hypothetical protein